MDGFPCKSLCQCHTCFAALLSGQVRQRRLRSAVATQRVAVFGRNVRRQRGRRGEFTVAILSFHGFLPTSPTGQERVAEQLAQQSILGEVIQELREVLQKRENMYIFLGEV